MSNLGMSEAEPYEPVDGGIARYPYRVSQYPYRAAMALSRLQ